MEILHPSPRDSPYHVYCTREDIGTTEIIYKALFIQSCHRQRDQYRQFKDDSRGEGERSEPLSTTRQRSLLENRQGDILRKLTRIRIHHCRNFVAVGVRNKMDVRAPLKLAVLAMARETWARMPVRPGSVGYYEQVAALR